MYIINRHWCVYKIIYFDVFNGHERHTERKREKERWYLRTRTRNTHTITDLFMHMCLSVNVHARGIRLCERQHKTLARQYRYGCYSVYVNIFNVFFSWNSMFSMCMVVFVRWVWLFWKCVFGFWFLFSLWYARPQKLATAAVAAAHRSSEKVLAFRFLTGGNLCFF